VLEPYYNTKELFSGKVFECIWKFMGKVFRNPWVLTCNDGIHSSNCEAAEDYRIRAIIG
jgi:hypothetical protein